LIKTGGKPIRCEIHKLIISILNEDKLPEERKGSILVPIYKEGDKTNCSNYRSTTFCQLRTKFYPTSCNQS